MSVSAEQVRQFRTRAASCHVAVLGDLLADYYVRGRPHKLSREAPIVVLRHESEDRAPGGAGSATGALAALGVRVSVVGRVGADPAGEYLRSALTELGADAAGLVTDPEWATPMKTRFLAGDEHTRKQQVLRIDRDPDGPGGRAAETAIVDATRRLLDEVDAVLVSDYGYGTVTPAIRDILAERQSDVFVTVDSRHNLPAFRHVSLATPNQQEAEEAAGTRIGSPEDAMEAATLLRGAMQAEAVIVTLGNQGMAVCDGDGASHIPVLGSAEAVDVSGAGDVVAAICTAARVGGATTIDAAWLGTLGAAVAVMKAGAQPVTPDEMLAWLEQGNAAAYS